MTRPDLPRPPAPFPFLYPLSSDIPDASAGLFFNEAGEVRAAAALQAGLFQRHGMILPHHEKEMTVRLRQGEDLVILPPGFRRSGLHKKIVGIEFSIGGAGPRQGAVLCDKAVDGVLFPADQQEGRVDRTNRRRLPDISPRETDN